MDYNLIFRPNPMDRTAPNRYYAQFVLGEKITLRKLAREIVARSTLTMGDVENCLDNFIDLLPTYILLGHAVQLGDFCTIRPTAHSHGSLTLGDWQVSNIYKITLTFTPGVLIKERLKADINYRLVSTKEQAENRRVSRAKAILKDPAQGAQLLQDHIEALSPEAAQQLLDALTKQVQAKQEAQEAQAAAADAPDSADTPTDTPTDAPTDTPTTAPDAPANPDTKSKK